MAKYSRRFGWIFTGLILLAGAAAVFWYLLRTEPHETQTPSLLDQRELTYFDLLRRAQSLVRAEPDHLAARFEKIVEDKDAIALISFVRSAFDVTPPSPRGWSSALTSMRWDERGVLRAGAGTPRELANLTLLGLERMGYQASLVSIRAPDQLRSFSHKPINFSNWSSREWDDLRERFDREPLPEAPPIERNLGFWEAANELVPADTLQLLQYNDRIQRLPTVQVSLGPNEDTLRRETVNLWAANEDPYTQARSASLKAQSAIPDVELEVLARSDRLNDNRPFTLVKTSISQADLAGAQTTFSFAPVTQDLSELLAMSADQMSTFIPSIQLRRAGQSPIISEGDAITISGNVIRAESLSAADDPPISSSGNSNSDVQSLEILSLSAAHYPRLLARLKATDANGISVGNVPPSAFAAKIDNQPQFIQFQHRPGPSVVFLVDASTSVPEIYRGENLEQIVLDISTRVLDRYPESRFAVAAIDASRARVSAWTSDPTKAADTAGSRSTPGSSLWRSYADIAKMPAVDAIVFFTDGQDVDFEERTTPPESLETVFGIAPPAIMVGAETEDQPFGPAFEGIANATRGVALNVNDVNAVIDQIAAQIEQTMGEYQMWINVSAGATNGEATLTLAVGDAEASEIIVVPTQEKRLQPPAFTGLYLRIKSPQGEVIRRIAGQPYQSAQAASADERLQVREAFLSQITLMTEAGSPSVAQIYDDILTAQLSWEAVLSAEDEVDLAEGLAKAHALPTSAFTFAVPLFAPGETALIHEMGLRYWIETERAILRDGRAYLERTVDLLPLIRVFSSKSDPEASKREALFASSLLTDIEAALYDQSSLERLSDRTLIATGRRFRSDDEARKNAFRKLSANAPRNLTYLIPAEGIITAGLSVDIQTGTIIGLLEDGSGGGRSVEEINRVFAEVDRLLAAVQQNAGPGSIAAWAGLERAKMKKLHQSTIAIATMTPPDVLGEIRDNVCGRISGAVDGAVEAGIRRVGGGGVGFVLDSVQEAIDRANSIGNSIGIGDVVSAPSVPIPGCE